MTILGYVEDEPGGCWHDSATGVDQAPFGPEKVWRCDGCGWLYRTVPVSDGTSHMEPVES